VVGNTHTHTHNTHTHKSKRHDRTSVRTKSKVDEMEVMFHTSLSSRRPRSQKSVVRALEAREMDKYDIFDTGTRPSGSRRPTYADRRWEIARRDDSPSFRLGGALVRPWRSMERQSPCSDVRVESFCPRASKACSLFVSRRSKQVHVPKKEIIFNNIFIHFHFFIHLSSKSPKKSNFFRQVESKPSSIFFLLFFLTLTPHCFL